MNQKGGTAKTVTAINTAAILARDYGHRVLLVDADSQANLTEFVQDQKKLALTAGGHSGLVGFRERLLGYGKHLKGALVNILHKLHIKGPVPLRRIGLLDPGDDSFVTV